MDVRDIWYSIIQFSDEKERGNIRLVSKNGNYAYLCSEPTLKRFTVCIGKELHHNVENYENYLKKFKPIKLIDLLINAVSANNKDVVFTLLNLNKKCINRYISSLKFYCKGNINGLDTYKYPFFKNYETELEILSILYNNDKKNFELYVITLDEKIRIPYLTFFIKNTDYKFIHQNILGDINGHAFFNKTYGNNFYSLFLKFKEKFQSK